MEDTNDNQLPDDCGSSDSHCSAVVAERMKAAMTLDEYIAILERLKSEVGGHVFVTAEWGAEARAALRPRREHFTVSPRGHSLTYWHMGMAKSKVRGAPTIRVG